MEAPIINETLRRNAETHLSTPPEYGKTPSGESYIKVAEGGFRQGTAVVISNPDDHYHGQRGVCGEPTSERTITVTVGGRTFKFCVAALELV